MLGFPFEVHSGSVYVQAVRVRGLSKSEQLPTCMLTHRYYGFDIRWAEYTLVSENISVILLEV